MLEEYIKLSDREFIVGYAVPVIIFLSLSFILISNYFPAIFISQDSYLWSHNHSSSNSFNETNMILNANLMLSLLENLWAITFLLLLVILVSIFLMLMNFILTQLLEGYGLLDKTFLHLNQLERYDKLQGDIKDIEEIYNKEKKENGEASLETIEKYKDLLLKFRERFPPKREDVLATSFGNIIRAFESYPIELYGMDPVPIWTRIMVVVPTDHRDLLRNAKSNVDFSVNMIYLMLILLIEFIICVVISTSIKSIWILLIAVLLVWLAYKLSLIAAIEWGEDVKAVFDLFRYDLLSKMGIEVPLTWEGEREKWIHISQSFLYWYEIDLQRKIK